MQPNDQCAIRNTVILFVVMIVLAGPRPKLWLSCQRAPLWLSYGVLYRAAMQIWWHKLGHRTAFETRRWNQIFFRTTCVWVTLCAAALTRALWAGSVLPLLVIGVLGLYGASHYIIAGSLQRRRLANSVLDHGLKTCKVYMNLTCHLICRRMHDQLQHHMLPLVPLHALPKLNALNIHNLPEPNTSILKAYAEMIPILPQRLRYKDHYLCLSLPMGAKPYRRDLQPTILRGV